MADNKPSTADILALCREQDGGGASSNAPAAEEPTTQPAADTPAPAEEASTAPAPPAGGPPPTFGDRPKSTADILAAARAETASGGSAPSESPAAKPQPAGGTPAKKEPAKPAAPASSGKTPSSTSDILAAARAQSGGGGEESAAAPQGTSDILAAARAQAGTSSAPSKPAAKPAAKKPAAPATAGDGGRPPVQEMLKAVREHKPIGGVEKKKPQLPQRPAPSKVRADDKPKRRNFLVAMFATPFALAWTSFVAASAAATLGFARFMLPNATVEPPSKFKVGIPDDYPLNTVTTKWKSEFAIWITHQVYDGQPQIYALSTVCTHLGCTPNWLEGEQKFKCPCHGSGFYGNGINFEGPAPRPLERYAIQVAPDGQLEVDKSQKFQEEMGQWNDPASFVATS